MMSKLKIIINLLLGKSIVIYNAWTKEVLMIIGRNDELIKNRYTYDFIGNESCLNIKKGKIIFEKEKTK